ncbi:MAG: hypothetical protein LBL72_07480 [Candidatus Accumulibacter sp.]|jgi:hypothetical protein|nr:hypothetical protein [Accumulibacter sp.]
MFPETEESSRRGAPEPGTRRIVDGVERVHYEGYWIKTYAIPNNALEAKKQLIEALTRRLFNHTEHGLNIPGSRLIDARESFQRESDPARWRVKSAMLAGALFNRAGDIFKKLVAMQESGVEILPENPLMRECGGCLLEAMELGRSVLHRSGDEGIDELWGEPFRAFSVPLEEFYETRYIKIAQSMRDIDQVAAGMREVFQKIPAFGKIDALIGEFAEKAKAKTELLRTDADILEAWPCLVAASDRLMRFVPLRGASDGRHSVSAGQRLLGEGRDLVIYISRARTPMPKSMNVYLKRCAIYLKSGRLPRRSGVAPLPD